MNRAIIIALAFATAAACGNSAAVPILFTVSGAVDGELNGQSFSDAKFRLDLRTDTADTVAVVENGVTVYRNELGQAELILTRGTQTTVAQIAANQIYVRYDPTNGVVGFGSFAVGPFYPVSLDWCGVPMQCGAVQTTSPQFNILGALVQLKVDPKDTVFYSSAVPGLATQLKGPALLGGFLDACYSIDLNTQPPSCPSKPSVPIKTNQGNLYFQKQNIFGTGIFTAVTGTGVPW